MYSPHVVQSTCYDLNGTGMPRVAYFSALRDSLPPRARLAIVDPRKGVPGADPPDEFRFTPEEIDED